MLGFLDSLCMALTHRDAVAIAQLLAHPMAATLPPAVRAEALALAADPANTARTPLHAFVFAHRMAHLMAAVRTPPESHSRLVTPVVSAGSSLSTNG